MKEVTDEQIIAEAQEILSNPQLRKCSQCTNSNLDCTYCSALKKPIAKYMYAGLCKHFETDEERIIRQTRDALERLAKEEKKMNHILTLSLNSMEVAMLYLEDFSSRIETEYKRAEAKGTGDPKVRAADRRWIYEMKRANKAMTKHLEGARKQFQHYVMPTLNKVFYDKETKEYDIQSYDDHQQDSFELAKLMLMYFEVAYNNKKNSDKIFTTMEKMESVGVMEEQDINRYNFNR